MLTRSRKLKNRQQYNDQKTHNNLQKTTHKFKIEQHDVRLNRWWAQVLPNMN